MQRLRDLQAVKDRFGELITLDFTRTDLQTAHRMLGEHVRLQVQKIIRQRLDRMDAAQFSSLMEQVSSCADMLAGKIADQHLNPLLRRAVQEYLDCLAAWADGAGLVGFDHPALTAYKPVSAINLALFLQHDSTGCQTGLYRQQDGSVILWHTEEDVEYEEGSGFDQLRLAAFNVGDDHHPVIMHAFIYPDLLPGPAFGWRSDGYTQAVDTLHTRVYPEQKAGMLANIVTWLTLRLGPDCDPAKVIADMVPFYDGYALNVVSLHNGKVHAEKYEFAEDHILQNILDHKTGSYLFQVNIFSQDTPSWVRDVQKLPPADYRLYKQRMTWTQTAIQNKDHRVSEADDMRFFFNLLTTRSGTIWSYANIHVKAYFILRLSNQGGEIWLGHGPALSTDKFTVIHVSPA
jgi:hypothetical protein